MTNQTKKADPEQYITDLFSKHDRIYLGGELREKLVKNCGKTNVAARKILERITTKGVIQSSSPVSFSKGAFAYFSLKKVINFDDLLGITRLNRPPLFRLLSAIKKCGGVISYYEALKITSSPLNTSKSKTLSLDNLIEELKFFKVVAITVDKHNVKYITANYVEPQLIDSILARHYALMMVDAVFIYDIITSLERLNLIDNRYIVYRNRKTPSLGAKHNNFVWDAFAYTKTTGINTVYGAKKAQTNKQALVVLDVVVSRNYEVFDFEGFFGRIQVLLNHTKKERKIIPVIVYKEISQEALKKARSLGLLTYNMAAFFGIGIYEVINNITDVKLSEHTSQGLVIDPVQVISDTLDLIDETGNKFNLQNVIGDFFQSLMYQLFHQLYPNCNIDQSVKLPAMDTIDDKVKSYEYDFVIFSNRTNEIIVVELKGSMNDYTIKKGDYKKKNTLQWFFGRTLPSFAKHYETGLTKNLKVKATFITSGKFEPDGNVFLSELNQGQLKPNLIDTGYDGKKLIQLVNNNSLSLLKNTLERYFVA